MGKSAFLGSDTSIEVCVSPVYPETLMPGVFTLEITTVCDNFCSGCANVELARKKSDRKTTNAFMTHWKEIIDKIALASNCKAIIRLSGGEPTLHPEFDLIISYIETWGMSFAILTTGRWTKGNIDRTLTLLKNSERFLGFLISLHGDNAADHCAFTESSSKAFVQTCNSIKKASAYGIRVFTNTVITNKNWNKISDIVLLSEKLGSAMAVFNRFVAVEHLLLPTTVQLGWAIQSVLSLRNAGRPCRVGNYIPKCFFPQNTYPTPAGFELCHISPSGRIRPDNFSHFAFGNILSDELSQIWNSDKAHFFRNHFPSSCLDCAALSVCRGGLKSLSIESPIAVGDPLMQGPLSFDQVHDWDDDKEKVNAVMLALTSD